ncbi:AAA family ATPase [Rhodococcus sp. BP-316]|uniref:AAA family ATPase n=1 Tax=Rhodococcus sp. BP-316 TaxID=2739445 RepID=UPI001C9A705A|nr:AAA family ATPase [Rhodococcus sp. BP-316]MBY6679931.1 AAA family ATPase [Rhodococcus sp. BP-316]
MARKQAEMAGARQEAENERALMRLRATETAHETVAREKADAAGIRPLTAMTMTAAEMMLATPPPALIEGVLDGGGMSMLVGTRGTGKSFVALDMALSIATGRRWGNHDTHSTTGRVLYLVGEGGGRSFGIRIEAWCRHHGVEPVELDGRFLAVDGAVPFMSSRWDELVAMATEFDPDLVMIDTLSRHAVGLEENSNSDAATGVAKAEALRGRTGSGMVLHHPPKGVTGGVNAGRGAGAWEAAVDTVLTLETADEGVVVVEATKQKHRPEGVVGHWRLDPVPVTPNGTWSSSLVPVPVDPMTLPSATAGLTALAAKAAAVEAWIVEAVAANPGKGASTYYRATGVERLVVVDGTEVAFSKADAEAAIERLKATGALVCHTVGARRNTLTVGSARAAEASS